jgi:hypothetical protein
MTSPPLQLCFSSVCSLVILLVVFKEEQNMGFLIREIARQVHVEGLDEYVDCLERTRMKPL